MSDTIIYLFPTNTFNRDELNALLEDDMEKLYLTYAIDVQPKVRKYTSLEAFTEALNDQEINIDSYWIYSFQHSNLIDALKSAPRHYVTFTHQPCIWLKDVNTYFVSTKDNAESESLANILSNNRQCQDVTIGTLPDINNHIHVFTSKDEALRYVYKDNGHSTRQWLAFRFDSPKEQTNYIVFSNDPDEMHAMEEFINTIPGITYRWKGQSDNSNLEKSIVERSVGITKDELYQKFTPQQIDNGEGTYWVTFTYKCPISDWPTAKYAVRCRDKRYASDIYAEVLNLACAHDVKVGRRKDGIILEDHTVMSVGKFRSMTW